MRSVKMIFINEYLIQKTLSQFRWPRTQRLELNLDTTFRPLSYGFYFTVHFQNSIAQNVILEVDCKT